MQRDLRRICLSSDESCMFSSLLHEAWRFRAWAYEEVTYPGKFLRMRHICVALLTRYSTVHGVSLVNDAKQYTMRAQLDLLQPYAAVETNIHLLSHNREPTLLRLRAMTTSCSAPLVTGCPPVPTDT